MSKHENQNPSDSDTPDDPHSDESSDLAGLGPPAGPASAKPVPGGANTASAPGSAAASQLGPGGQPKHPSAGPRLPHQGVQSVQPFDPGQPAQAGTVAANSPQPVGRQSLPPNATKVPENPSAVSIKKGGKDDGNPGNSAGKQGYEGVPGGPVAHSYELTAGTRTPRLAIGSRVIMGRGGVEPRAGIVTTMRYDGDTEFYGVTFDDGGGDEVAVPGPLLSACLDDEWTAIEANSRERIAAIGV